MFVDMATGINLSGLRKRDGEKIPKLIKIFKQKQPLIFLIFSPSLTQNSAILTQEQ